jgi:hypothetical protein
LPDIGNALTSPAGTAESARRVVTDWTATWADSLAKNEDRGSNTCALFLDNGPHREGGYDPDFTDQWTSAWHQRNHYEGGIRVNGARWPGRFLEHRQ